MLWILNIITYIINAVVVGGSQFGWFGETNADISDAYPTLITPDGYAFSIWGVIFFFELVFVLWGALPSNRDDRIIDDGVGCWFAIACVAQAAWSVTFAQESLVASAVLLCLIASSLLMAVVSLAKFKYEHTVLFCTTTFWTVHFPIGLHGGWTLAAALVNINIALELDSVSSQTAALFLSVTAAAVMASFASVLFYDPIYLVAVAWAIGGIASKKDYRLERLGKPVADGVDEALTGLWVALLCVGVLGLFARMRQRNRHASHEEEKRGGAGQSDLTSAIFSH